MRIYSSNDTESEFGAISGLYCGDALSGKTHYACTWPNPLVICFDPDTQTARKSEGVWVLEPANWSEFSNFVMPYVRNRSLGKLVQESLGLPTEPPINTLVIDSISLGATRLAQEIQGAKPNLTQQDFGKLLNTLLEVTVQCTDTTRRTAKEQPTYNVIFTSHIVGVTDEQGNVTSYRPAIMGQFKEMLPKLMGFSFMCEHKTEMVFGRPGESAQVKEQFHVRTVPPDTRYILGDRIGGGRYKRLPITCDGSYPALVKAWGLDPEVPK